LRKAVSKRLRLQPYAFLLRKQWETDQIAQARRSSPTPTTRPSLSISYNGKYPRLSHAEQGFDSLYRRVARPPGEALHAKTSGSTPDRLPTRSRKRSFGGDATAAVSLSRKSKLHRGFTTRARNISQLVLDARSRLISADRMVRFHQLRPRLCAHSYKPYTQSNAVLSRGGVLETSRLLHSSVSLFCRCRTAASMSVSPTDDTGSIPVTDTIFALSAVPRVRRWPSR
jgi:hypothetical protein